MRDRPVPSERAGRATAALAGRSPRGRAVSTTVNYALSLGITSILIVGLLLSAGAILESQRERATRDELRVVGDRIAADVVAVDGAARAPADTDVRTVAVRTELPRRIAGEPYRVRVAANGTAPDEVTITLSLPATGTVVRVRTGTRAPVAGGTFDGGPLRVRYDGATGEVVVADG